MKKDEVITFKASDHLAAELKKLPNRSEFIRRAILNALENSCPLCNGTGIMTPEQNLHWQDFSSSHSLHKCDDCSATHIVCKVDHEN